MRCPEEETHMDIRPRLVLMVDDDPMIREAVVARLELEGFEAVEAGGGQ